MFILDVAGSANATFDVYEWLKIAALLVGLFIVWKIVKFVGGRKTPVAETITAAEPAPKIPEKVETVEPVMSRQDDSALIAVLTAAIIEYNKADGTVYPAEWDGTGLRIVSFKERNRIV